MLIPKRVKRRKQQRGRMKGKATRGNKIAYGEFGIMALEPCWITSNQIEAARIAMTRYTKRGGQVWIDIFPHKPVTKKPAETRMGNGKGAPEFWVAVVQPGRILFEMAGVAEDVAREALRLAQHKLPCKTKVVKKGEEQLAAKQSAKPEVLLDYENAAVKSIAGGTVTGIPFSGNAAEPKNKTAKNSETKALKGGAV